MNKINAQLSTSHLNSRSECPLEQLNSKAMFHDVYSVCKIKKRYLWCLGFVQQGLKRALFWLSNAPSTGAVKYYQTSTSQGEETLSQKVAVAFWFSASVLLVCFCGFVVF